MPSPRCRGRRGHSKGGRDRLTARPPFLETKPTMLQPGMSPSWQALNKISTPRASSGATSSPSRSRSPRLNCWPMRSIVRLERPSLIVFTMAISRPDPQSVFTTLIANHGRATTVGRAQTQCRLSPVCISENAQLGPQALSLPSIGRFHAARFRRE